jgi:hypothetical protein
MDSPPPGAGYGGAAEADTVVPSSEIGTNHGEVKSSDERNESGAGALNPSLPKVPVFKEPKPMGPPSSMPPPSMPPPSMPPPSMPPPKITKVNLPGPMGPPPMRVKQSKEEVKEPVQSSASEGTLLFSFCRFRKVDLFGNSSISV